MKKQSFAERSAELRQSVGEAELELDMAVETLGRAATSELTLGGRLAQNPWGWLLGACAIGVIIGLRRSGN